MLMPANLKVVYSISTRGGKDYWTRVGSAFVNSDGSLNVQLECVPIDGRLHIRDFVPRDRIGEVSSAHARAQAKEGSSDG